MTARYESPSETRLRVEMDVADKRRAANRKRCPLAVAAMELAGAALECSLPEPAREHLEEQHATLSDLVARGREINQESAERLVEFVMAVTGE